MLAHWLGSIVKSFLLWLGSILSLTSWSFSKISNEAFSIKIVLGWIIKDVCLWVLIDHSRLVKGLVVVNEILWEQLRNGRGTLKAKVHSKGLLLPMLPLLRSLLRSIRLANVILQVQVIWDLNLLCVAQVVHKICGCRIRHWLLRVLNDLVHHWVILWQTIRLAA